jgi:xanthine dehydrogenase accessory factor
MFSNDAVLERAASLKAAGKPFALVTVVRCESPTSAKPGAKAIVEPDGVIQGWIGGGCAQPAVVKVARQAIQDGQSRLIRISPSKDGSVEEGIMDFGMTCHSGGTLDIFVDAVIPRPSLLIIGGSPAAQTLCGLAQRVGFSVTAAFPGADRDMFPDADQIIDGLDLAGLVTTPPFVVVATQGKRDEPGLEAALATWSPYIAFIASARKAEMLREYLKERGHDRERVEAIEAPAGVEIGAVTPEEIALSVLARVVQERRRQLAAGEASMVVGAATETRVSAPANSCCGHQQHEREVAIDPICGMSVDVATAEYRAEYNGKTFCFCCPGCQHTFEKSPEKYWEAAMEAV